MRWLPYFYCSRQSGEYACARSLSPFGRHCVNVSRAHHDPMSFGGLVEGFGQLDAGSGATMHYRVSYAVRSAARRAPRRAAERAARALGGAFAYARAAQIADVVGECAPLHYATGVSLGVLGFAVVSLFLVTRAVRPSTRGSGAGAIWLAIAVGYVGALKQWLVGRARELVHTYPKVSEGARVRARAFATTVSLTCGIRPLPASLAFVRNLPSRPARPAVTAPRRRRRSSATSRRPPPCRSR